MEETLPQDNEVIQDIANDSEMITIPRKKWEHKNNELERKQSIIDKLLEEKSNVIVLVNQLQEQVDTFCKQFLIGGLRLQSRIITGQEPYIIDEVIQKDKDGNEIFFDTEKDIEFEVNLRNPSGKVLSDLLELRSQYAKDINGLIKEYGDKYPALKVKEIEIEKLTPEENEAWFEYNGKLRVLDYDYNLKYFKVIIDDKDKTTQEKALLRSDIHSDFYRNLNPDEIGKTVYSFRVHYKI